VSSDGERQGSEMIHMAILEPELAILDQTDAVLDGDALRVISLGIQEMRVARPSMGIVLIAGDQRLLEAIQPDHVHTIIDGRIVHSDDIAACRVPA
jgi:Fe-S cluster assembly ATP-binding protein